MINRELEVNTAKQTLSMTTSTALTTAERNMSIHRYDAVNPLVNPVKSADVIIAESGERYIVCQGMCGSYSLKHAKTGQYLGGVYDSQISICGYIENNFMNI